MELLNHEACSKILITDLRVNICTVNGIKASVIFVYNPEILKKIICVHLNGLVNTGIWLVIL